jgi:hypothetical protein
MLNLKILQVMAKKEKQMVVARLAITGPVSYMREEVDKSKKANKLRGPRESGQKHESIPIVIHLDEEEYKKRLEVATSILKTGKIPVDEETVESVKKLTALSIEQSGIITEKNKVIEAKNNELENLQTVDVNNQSVINSLNKKIEDMGKQIAELKKPKAAPKNDPPKEEVKANG